MYREGAEEVLAPFEGGRHAEATFYLSPFRTWHQRASVRVKPERTLGDDGTVYFPPELVPIVNHQLVQRLGPAARAALLVHRLYEYLHFTSELEELAVLPVAVKISRGRAGLSLPTEMRRDAFKIVTDEAWHAQFSYELLAQVAERTGVPVQLPACPAFVSRLDRIRTRLSHPARGVEAVLFAVISETLISTILSDLPGDVRLPAAVRELVRDHAEDEGRHHAYFKRLLDIVWPALDRGVVAQVGPLLPEMIRAFLAPDGAALSAALRQVGVPPDDIDQVIAESWPPDRVTAHIAQAATGTVRYLANLGALDDPSTADAFVEAGLWCD